MSKILLVSDGKPLPYAYRFLVEHGVTQFGPWCFIEDQAGSDALRTEFVKEVAAPNPSKVKDFQPFASMSGICDDFAGFVIRDGHATNEVLGVHLTWLGRPENPGWPDMQLFPDIWAFLSERVIPEMAMCAERFEAYHDQESKQPE
jgi:hypothetical protein